MYLLLLLLVVFQIELGRVLFDHAEDATVQVHLAGLPHHLALRFYSFQDSSSAWFKCFLHKIQSLTVLMSTKGLSVIANSFTTTCQILHKSLCCQFSLMDHLCSPSCNGFWCFPVAHSSPSQGFVLVEVLQRVVLLRRPSLPGSTCPCARSSSTASSPPPACPPSSPSPPSSSSSPASSPCPLLAKGEEPPLSS